MKNSNLTFCYDRIYGKSVGYPNLAEFGHSWKKWDFMWPNTVKLRFLKFFTDNGFKFEEVDVKSAPVGSWYPVAFSWFNFDCDYIDLIPKDTYKRIKNREVKILFYYHEADNPYHIKERIDFLLEKHQLPNDCYLFVSANTAANNIENFVYFTDHESFFANINRRQSSFLCTRKEKEYDFSVLSRTHKWWRSTCYVDLLTDEILDNSIWSYNTDIAIDDRQDQNPIDLSMLSINKKRIREFVENGPYLFDKTDIHNNHRDVNVDIYRKSYFHIVIETHFDADGSGGVFLTEKTFKPLKFGQPFLIAGTAHSLKLLRSLGYNTFDHVLNNEYDSIEDNTERWKCLSSEIKRIKSSNIKELFYECYPDVIYNQYMFSSRIEQNLQYLIDKINCKQ